MIEHDEEGLLTVPLSRTIGSKTGLAKNLYYDLPSREDPLGGLEGNCDILDVAAYGNVSDEEIEARGNGFSVQQTVTTLLGEVVERYQNIVINPKTERTSYDSLSESHNMVNQEYLNFYSRQERERAVEAGLPLDKFEVSKERNWVAGIDLISGEQTYLPVELVTWHELNDDESPLFFPTSDGLACHESLPRALLSSIYEYLERHAFMEMWFTGKIPDKIETEEFPTENDYVKHHLLDYNTNIDIDIPLLGCISRRKERTAAYICFCGGAASTYRSAIRETLLETTQFWNSSAKYAEAKDIESPNEIVNLIDNVLYYYDPDNSGPLEERLTGKVAHYETNRQKRQFDVAEKELEFVLEQLRSVNVTPIAFDLTSNDVTNTGLVVTRVVIPELLPLSPPSFPPDAHPALAGRIEVDDPHPYP